MGVEPSNVVIDYIMKDSTPPNTNQDSNAKPTDPSKLADWYINQYGNR